MPEEEIPRRGKSSPKKQRKGIIFRFEHLGGFTKWMITWLGAVASLIAALVGATYLIAPDLKPRDKLGAALDRIGIEQSVDHAAYERKMSDADSSSPVQGPSPHGIEVLVHASLYGYSDRFYSVEITLLEAESLKEINADLSTCEVRSPKANEDGVTWRCWTSSPPPGTAYIVRAEIFDDGQYEGPKDEGPSDNLLLDFLDSPKFTALPPA
ncbi:hypothetical protein AB0N24_04455 [Arthrobacter sp. NPDC093128]|uniref:hypothetical protein n=1 Tax=Arthrobacter sp. NPDC093128 TaxID=3154979 RepID=UPI00343D49AB